MSAGETLILGFLFTMQGDAFLHQGKRGLEYAFKFAGIALSGLAVVRFFI